MNDVLPKPFTKEGCLSMLEKHLQHLKKKPTHIDPMGAPPAPLVKLNRSIKSEDSPATSPATASNWNSPGNFSGVSPAASQHPDDAHLYTPNSAGPYSVQPAMRPPPIYNGTPGGAIGVPLPPHQPHRRGISDISGGPAEVGGDVKRQQMYAPAPSIPPQMQAPMPPRPR